MSDRAISLTVVAAIVLIAIAQLAMAGSCVCRCFRQPTAACKPCDCSRPCPCCPACPR